MNERFITNSINSLYGKDNPDIKYIIPFAYKRSIFNPEKLKFLTKEILWNCVEMYDLNCYYYFEVDNEKFRSVHYNIFTHGILFNSPELYIKFMYKNLSKFEQFNHEDDIKTLSLNFNEDQYTEMFIESFIELVTSTESGEHLKNKLNEFLKYSKTKIFKNNFQFIIENKNNNQILTQILKILNFWDKKKINKVSLEFDTLIDLIKE